MSIFIILLGLLIALLVSSIVYPFVITFAKKHNIVDNPDIRKLQRHPVPVLGGISVFIGIATSLLFTAQYTDWYTLYGVIIFMFIMLIIGLLDDIMNLSATLRFCLEIIFVWGYIVASHSCIENFHGLWQVYTVSPFISIPLSILAGVGIINSINLIDGVDGYSSGYCISAFLCFFVLFMIMQEYVFACFAMICVGGLIPFYLHNAFGQKSKMYIGDSGTLMMGAALTCCVFMILSQQKASSILAQQNIGLIAFCLAVLGIPIFDTLRVMFARIIRGHSPFMPDKTHLHHLFIDLGFSHIGCGTIIICMNLINVMIWFLTYTLGLSIDIQFYAVITSCLLTTFGFNRWMRYCIKKQNRVYKFMIRFGVISHIERTGFWLFLQNLIDGKLLKK